MSLKKNWAEKFQELNTGLVPADETIRAVIRVMPKGESARRGEQGSARVLAPPPIPINLQGTAASWPNQFARHDTVPDSWSSDIYWFFWVVLTDKQLHAIEGHTGKWKDDPKAGPEAAHFSLDQIAEIYFDKGMLSQLTIWFKDGSSVELEAGMQEFRPWQEAIRPFEQAESQRPRGRKPGFLRSGYWLLLGIALLVGGMAVSIGAPSDARTARLLADQGVHTNATVTDISLSRVGLADPVAELQLEFHDEFGLSRTTTINYCGDAEKYGIGDKVEIRYDPDDPEVANFADCHYPTQENIAFFIGVVCIVLGTIVVLRVWASSGWKRWWIGIPIAIFGVLFGGTAFTEECNCKEAAYISAALVLIGLAAVIGSRFKRSAPHNI